jgi:hypothetical protein
MTPAAQTSEPRTAAGRRLHARIFGLSDGIERGHDGLLGVAVFVARPVHSGIQCSETLDGFQPLYGEPLCLGFDGEPKVGQRHAEIGI